jgi:hypothetical protein
MLDPFGVEVHPIGVGAHDIDAVVTMTTAAERFDRGGVDVVAASRSRSIPSAVTPVSTSAAIFAPPDASTVAASFPAPIAPDAHVADAHVADVVPVSSAPAEPFVEREWKLLVRVLGGIRIHDDAGESVRFERNKAQELVCWLALHRHHSTRSGVRAALWETDVRDASFANVVSDARRSLARHTPPPDGQEWVGRTLTDLLPLHPHVVTDAELLRDRLDAARGRSHADAIELLRPGLALVTDIPFAGTGYLWPDATGTVTELVLLATAAAVHMAGCCLELDDIDGVFWATGQGLRVLSGHEELVAFRMRAHARQGDLAAVRAEWASYERALAADPWSDAEPAPKLVQLRRELLASATVSV